MPPKSKEEKEAVSRRAKASVQGLREFRGTRATARASTPSSSSQHRRTTGTPTRREVIAASQALLDEIKGTQRDHARDFARLRANVGTMATTVQMHGETLVDHEERLDEHGLDIAASNRNHVASNNRMTKLEIFVGLFVLVAAALYLRGPVIESEIARWADSIKSYFD